MIAAVVAAIAMTSQCHYCKYRVDKSKIKKDSEGHNTCPDCAKRTENKDNV